MFMYGLMHKETKIPLGVSICANADESVSYSFCLYNTGDMLWLVDDRNIAFEALNKNTKWYVTDYQNPSHFHGMKKSDYEIFGVEFKNIP